MVNSYLGHVVEGNVKATTAILFLSMLNPLLPKTGSTDKSQS